LWEAYRFGILRPDQASRTDRTTMEIESSFICPYCFQENTILIDITAGTRQEYIEDCEVCCRPAKLSVVVDQELETAEVSADIP